MTRRERLLTERAHHQKAFEYYYSLGEKRSLSQVAQYTGLSLSTVRQCCWSFKWVQRVQERDADAARQIADRTMASKLDEHERNQRIVKMALLKVAKAIGDGKVRIQMADLDRLIRLDALLSGRSVDDLGVADREAVRQGVRDYLETLDIETLERLAGAAPSLPPELPPEL